MRTFNTTAVCVPERHYMVDLTTRLIEVKRMVDAGNYFTINRARQYGKTTLLNALSRYIKKEYFVLDLDFQAMDNDSFQNGGTFAQGLARMMMDASEFRGVPIPEKYFAEFEKISEKDTGKVRMDDIFRIFLRWCRESDKPIVLMIDEVDSATNNQVFLDFLAQLRLQYIERQKNTGYKTFQSVILAGVTDIKNLKRKLRPDEASKFNSPWNVAVDFKVDMSFHPSDIAGMLEQYEDDHHTGMAVTSIAQDIFDYTGGYPFLVSRICQLIDTELVHDDRFGSLSSAWTPEGVSEVVRRILMEKNTLFESLMGKVYDNPKLSQMLQSILFAGDANVYNAFNIPISDAEMYGFIMHENGKVKIANRIFEMLLYNFYLSADEWHEKDIYKADERDKEVFIENDRLNMEHILERFVTGFDDIYGSDYETFDEAEGRRRFLLYIRPIINGTGNYYIEAETRNRERMDLVIDYLGTRYVVELKIWRGKTYHESGERQLADYLNHYHLDKGYMLCYNFNQKKDTGLHVVKVEDKELVEAFV